MVNSFASSVTARNTVVVHRRLSRGHDVELVETNRRGHATRFAHDVAHVVFEHATPFPYQLDGDYLGETDRLEFHHVPDAVRLAMPAPPP